MSLDSLDIATVVVNVRVAKVQDTDRSVELNADRYKFAGLFVFALVAELALTLGDEFLDGYVIVWNRREFKVFVDFLGRITVVGRFRDRNAACFEVIKPKLQGSDVDLQRGLTGAVCLLSGHKALGLGRVVAHGPLDQQFVDTQGRWLVVDPVFLFG